MHKISGIYEDLPEWIECSRSLVPDFIVIDPKEAPVWEIAGTCYYNVNVFFACFLFHLRNEKFSTEFCFRSGIYAIR